MEYKEVIEKYVETFGEKPVFKGRTWNLEEYEIMELLLKAIKSGIPYEEDDISDGTVY